MHRLGLLVWAGVVWGGGGVSLFFFFLSPTAIFSFDFSRLQQTEQGAGFAWGGSKLHLPKKDKRTQLQSLTTRTLVCVVCCRRKAWASLQRESLARSPGATFLCLPPPAMLPSQGPSTAQTCGLVLIFAVLLQSICVAITFLYFTNELQQVSAKNHNKQQHATVGALLCLGVACINNSSWLQSSILVRALCTAQFTRK